MHDISSQSYSEGRSVDVSKVLRNTYALLAVTLAWSAVTAGISMALNLGYGVGLVCSLISLGLLWFVLPRTANSAAGLWVVFGFTGLLGLGLGPTLNHYIAVPGGGSLIMQALGGTALVFFGLSGYVLTTGKGMILYTTSEIIHGGETNYLLATTSLYLAIYNLFTSLLHLLGAFGDD